MNFKLTNSQLIQIAAVDSGLDPFAEYCTKGMWENAGYKIQKGEKPVLQIELWCPRERKASEGSEAQESGEKLPGMFFQFKKCHLFTRSQVISADELAQEKEAKKIKKAQEKKFKRAIMAQGGIKPDQDYSIPQWCKRSEGLPLDVAVDEIAQQGWPVQDADGLFSLLQAM